MSTATVISECKPQIVKWYLSADQKDMKVINTDGRLVQLPTNGLVGPIYSNRTIQTVRTHIGHYIGLAPVQVVLCDPTDHSRPLDPSMRIVDLSQPVAVRIQYPFWLARKSHDECCTIL